MFEEGTLVDPTHLALRIATMTRRLTQHQRLKLRAMTDDELIRWLRSGIDDGIDYYHRSLLILNRDTDNEVIFECFEINPHRDPPVDLDKLRGADVFNGNYPWKSVPKLIGAPDLPDGVRHYPIYFFSAAQCTYNEKLGMLVEFDTDGNPKTTDLGNAVTTVVTSGLIVREVLEPTTATELRAELSEFSGRI